MDDIKFIYLGIIIVSIIGFSLYVYESDSKYNSVLDKPKNPPSSTVSIHINKTLDNFTQTDKTCSKLLNFSESSSCDD